ncbi:MULTISPECIES: hypothetical protein [Brevibacillus]|uniref:hypothetical protein n=1 Tax=Brevibacillus TaxID=55080 RepID=UPI000D0F31E8|nr:MULTISPECIES: hypothetical protein [Brevibacillus]PSJ63220.1 hypothetical protein C7J99_31575 [Brevibacillus brevis]RED35847.1 hypothetical protein DES34_101510 [Brevibacillus brevis]TQK41813.1 hypothetical protein FB479_11810 [Brevibacillus sp. AG162]VEF89044.1 Uncharacterised protein [Brevibacillus brevis]GEC93053.1 hypothetical protein BBR01nite_53840 [Brevibacillus brevis]
MLQYKVSDYLQRLEEEGIVYFLHSGTGKILEISPEMIELLSFLTEVRTEEELMCFIAEQNPEVSNAELAEMVKTVSTLLEKHALVQRVD